MTKNVTKVKKHMRVTSQEVKRWRRKYYIQPDDAGMGKNPFTRDRWNLAKLSLAVTIGLENKNERTIKTFPGTLQGLRQAEDYIIKLILSGKRRTADILVKGVGKYNCPFKRTGKKMDNYMQSFDKHGNSWW